ncbi:hypothetical protein [Streptomyces cylindrosporus]|uniref:Uncharacterized protein n=1 Tax=Streptomyces cylindrosporus TaxID=2927583 RepID=A0ABS9YKE3_9ACTN|nr:hypothetical protein [Streptomyces cylindrosporus]MCI3277635.1 hypothetical protein [Streptomyces cylindrosporus]
MSNRHRLVVRSEGAPDTTTIELDGEPLSFVSRVELVVDARGHAEARIVVPGAIVDMEADAEAFVLAHVPRGTDGNDARDDR